MLKNFWTKGNKENKLWYLGQKKNYTTTRHNTTQHNTTQHNTTQHNTESQINKIIWFAKFNKKS